MYSKTTKGVTVTVTPYFLDDQSSPQESHYVWAYQVNIKNLSTTTMKLNHRNWLIIDANVTILSFQRPMKVDSIDQVWVYRHQVVFES